jgi:hypothetical protein
MVGTSLSIVFLIAIAIFMGIVWVAAGRKPASETDQPGSRRKPRR